MDRCILDQLLLKRGVHKITGELKVGKRRVREVREKAIAHGYLSADGKAPGSITPPLAPIPLFADPQDGRSLRVSPQEVKLSDRLEWIKERLTAGWSRITVFEELGIHEVSRSSFYRYLDRHSLHELGKNLRGSSLMGPIFHEPGEALILDWGKLRDVIDPKTQKKRTLWAFVGVLGYSRFMMVRLVWTNDSTSTQEAIESMLQEMGGVPRRLTSDNPKCFALEASKYDPLLNPSLLRFAAHYGFIMECLPPADPQKKGKVERMMPYVRRIFESYPDDFVSLEHAQNHMNRKVAIANERRHGTTCQKPVTVFLEKEVNLLKALPALSYEREEVTYPTVRKDGFVRFANKYYAVAEEHIGKDVVVIATATQVSIYDQGRVLELYNRITEEGSTHAIKDHLRKSWQRIEEQNQGLLSLAQKIGKNTEAFVQTVLSRGEGFVDTRIVWGLLSLDKTYPREVIDQAAGIALEMNTLSSRLVERLIKLTLQKSKFKERPHPPHDRRGLATSKFIRPMSAYSEQIKSGMKSTY